MKSPSEEELKVIGTLEIDDRILCLARCNGGTLAVLEHSRMIASHWQGANQNNPTGISNQIYSRVGLNGSLERYFWISAAGTYRMAVKDPAEIPVEQAPQSVYSFRLHELVDQMIAIRADRDEKYGDSWKDEGPDGLMYNVLKKVRRLWNSLMVDGEVPDPDDGLDLAWWSLMIIALTGLEPVTVERMKVQATHGLFEEVLPTDEHNGRDE